ncbi:MAG: FKBP-type peptidyl-prolyl cis-trans isomerase [Dyella sp.]
MRRLLRSLATVAMLCTLGGPALAQDAAVSTLQIIDHTIGQGALAQAGQTVKVNYTGWLYDAAAPDHHGKQFDSNLGEAPISFPLGNGVVIEGWDQGIDGMRVGGTRTLIVPAKLGYGSRGAGADIPPHAALVFDVELVGVEGN